ncbi:MAG: T9SS type A sorting domain-containing protein, partial [Cyclobacteriaceae bacterium]|nr:T9SS type A sorting domain-containing protein [Cyclobacteriaceae bacterium]
WNTLGGSNIQNLALENDTLNISSGNFVVLKDYLDNTDNQDMSITGSILSIENGNSVDLSSITNNTDEQTLALNENLLSISGGNSVDLSTYLDDKDQQNLTGSIDGETLTIDIENGSSAVVDLSSLLAVINTKLEEQEAKLTEQEEKIALIDDLNTKLIEQAEQIAIMEEDIALLKTQAITGLDTSIPGIELGQSSPNPSNGRISISFNIPNEVRDAQIRVYDLKGILYMKIPIQSRGQDSVEIHKGELNPGPYLYTLIAEGSKVDTKKMIVQ